MLLGVIGTTPTSYIYAAIGAEIGAWLGRFADDLFRLPWPIFRILGGLVAYLISLIAMLAWAVALWGILGAGIGWILDFSYRTLKSFRERQA